MANKERATCKKGHPMEDPNLIYRTRNGKPSRECRTCANDRLRVARKVYARKAAKKKKKRSVEEDRSIMNLAHAVDSDIAVVRKSVAEGLLEQEPPIDMRPIEEIAAGLNEAIQEPDIEPEVQAPVPIDAPAPEAFGYPNGVKRTPAPAQIEAPTAPPRRSPLSCSHGYSNKMICPQCRAAGN